jgi:hypothetical protein
VSAGNCTAAGEDGDNEPFVASATGGVWDFSTELSGPPDVNGGLDGVSCVSAVDCTAVGGFANDQLLAVSESGGVWGTAAELNSPPGGGGILEAVSCASAVDCTAAGYDRNNQPVVVSETGGVWGTPAELSGTPGGAGDLYGVSCVSALDCTAVGYDRNGQPLVVSESGGVWGTPIDLSGTPGGGGALYGVSCASAGNCSAAGLDGNGQPVVVSESGGVWGTPTELSSTPGGGGELLGVSCVSAGNCTAAGGDGNGQPLVVSESGGVWGTPTELSGTPGGGGELYGVSCPSAGDCGAAGKDANDQPMVVNETEAPPTSLGTVLSAGGQMGVSVSVPSGTAVSDQATLTGTNAGEATGTVTYSVYSDNACTLEVGSPDVEPITTPGIIPASQPVTLSQPGTYYWQASYSGDALNQPSTSGCGAEVETVTSVATGADLQVSVSAPAQVATGSTFQVSVTVKNEGPQTALRIVTGFRVPRKLQIVSVGAGTQLGRLVYATYPSLAPNDSVTYTITLEAPAGETGSALLLADALARGSTDPNLRNNFAAQRITFLQSGTALRGLRFASRTPLSRLRAGRHAQPASERV